MVVGVLSSLSLTFNVGTCTLLSLPGFACVGSVLSSAIGFLLIPKSTFGIEVVFTSTVISPSPAPSVCPSFPVGLFELIFSPSALFQLLGREASVPFSCVERTSLYVVFGETPLLLSKL